MLKKKIISICACLVFAAALCAGAMVPAETGTALAAEETAEQCGTEETDETDETEEALEETEESGEEDSSSAETEDEEAAEEAEEPSFTVEDTDPVTLYATLSLNVREGPGTEYDVAGVLSTGDSVTQTGVTDNGWSRIEYDGGEYYASSKYLSEDKPEVKETSSSSSSSSGSSQTSSYPMSYSDSTCSITVSKEWYGSAWCYIAHVTLSDYSRLATSCGNGTYGGYETTGSAASRLGAILCVNGDYSAPSLDYGVVRNGTVYNDKACYVPAIYNGNTGIFTSPESAGVAGQQLSSLVSSGQVKDTFCFGPAFLTGGVASQSSDTSRAQRTFMGSTGKAGEFYIVVSEGRYSDGESAGLTYSECANLLKSKGCTFGIPLDGGGSSTIVFQGKVLNHVSSQRAVVDFVYVK